MPTVSKGKFSLSIGVAKLEADLGEEDRQCAWELYTELSTRVAVTGKVSDPTCTDFTGELYYESLSSLYRFFQEARGIMRRFPVGRLPGFKEDHLGFIIAKMMAGTLRPFLEKWQVDYRHWWESCGDLKTPPLERQKAYPKIEEFLSDWASVRFLMRQLQDELVRVYGLVSIHDEPKQSD